MNSDNPELMDALELDARDRLGEEALQQRYSEIERLMVPLTGTGDLPPGYDPEADPLVHRRREVARKVVLTTLAGAGVIAAVSGIVKYARQHKSEGSENA